MNHDFWGNWTFFKLHFHWIKCKRKSWWCDFCSGLSQTSMFVLCLENRICRLGPVAPQCFIYNDTVCCDTFLPLLKKKKLQLLRFGYCTWLNYSVLHWTHCRAVVLHCQVFLLFCPTPVLSCRALKLLKYNWNMLLQSSVTLDDVFSFLVDFRADESLCRGTQIWNQVSRIKDTGRNTEP